MGDIILNDYSEQQGSPSILVTDWRRGLDLPIEARATNRLGSPVKER